MHPSHIVKSPLRAIGQCIMVGSLIGMLATQSVAQGAVAPTPQPPTQQATSPSTTIQPNLNTTSGTATHPHGEANPLPEAPAVPYEQASVKTLPNLKAMMSATTPNDDGTQPATQRPRETHKGWLGLTVAGGALLAFGAVAFSKAKPGASGRTGGATLMGIGGGLTGLSLYLVFR